MRGDQVVAGQEILVEMVNSKNLVEMAGSEIPEVAGSEIVEAVAIEVVEAVAIQVVEVVEVVEALAMEVVTGEVAISVEIETRQEEHIS